MPNQKPPYTRTEVVGMVVPGPWYAVENTVFKDFGNQRYAVAHVEGWAEDTLPTTLAIAAVPEMIKLLEEYIDSVDIRRDKDPIPPAEMKRMIRAQNLLFKIKGD